MLKWKRSYVLLLWRITNKKKELARKTINGSFYNRGMMEIITLIILSLNQINNCQNIPKLYVNAKGPQ